MATDRFLSQLRTEVDTLEGPTQRILFAPYIVPNHAFSLGRPVYVSDPYLYAFLWTEGKLSVDSFIASVADAYFDVVLLPPDEDPQRPRYRFRTGTDRFYDALRRTYRLERTGLFQYHVPRAGPRPPPSAGAPEHDRRRRRAGVPAAAGGPAGREAACGPAGVSAS